MHYEVVSIESQADIDRRKSGMTLTLSPTKLPSGNILTPGDPDEDSGEWVCLLKNSIVF